jgi:hypothetical protein
MARKAKREQSAKGKGAGKKGGNPPEDTRFRPGRSGNPEGRPKGSKNLSTLLKEAASDQVSATIGGKTRKISKIQATTMQLATKAAGGDNAAIARFLDWIDEIETRAAAVKPAQFPLSEVDVEVLRAAYERMKQCEPKQPED